MPILRIRNIPNGMTSDYTTEETCIDYIVHNGDIVVGMDGEEATVKRLLIKDKTVIFMPENEDFDPIYPENPTVLGKVVGSYRKY